MCDQLVVCGHFMPFNGRQRDRAGVLVLQWYIDQILSLSKRPTKMQVLVFFLTIDTNRMCKYCEMTQGTGVSTLKMRQRLSQLQLGQDSEAAEWEGTSEDRPPDRTAEFLEQANPDTVAIIHDGPIKEFISQLRNGHRWSWVDDVVGLGDFQHLLPAACLEHQEERHWSTALKAGHVSLAQNTWPYLDSEDIAGTRLYPDFPTEGITIVINEAAGLSVRGGKEGGQPPRGRIRVQVTVGETMTCGETTWHHIESKDSIPEWEEFLHVAPERLGWRKSNQGNTKLKEVTLELIGQMDPFAAPRQVVGRAKLKLSVENLSSPSWKRHCRVLRWERYKTSTLWSKEHNLPIELFAEMPPYLVTSTNQT